MQHGICFWLLAAALVAGPKSLAARDIDSLVQTVTFEPGSPIPQMTVVPPLAPARQIGEQTTEILAAKSKLSHKERRTLRAEQFRNRIDSLVQSRSFIFWPNSMQRYPSGTLHLIYNGYYYFGLYQDHVEVHLPVEEQLTSFVGVENFDTMEIADYLLTARPAGWEISFRIPDGGSSYLVEFLISNHTGETILNLKTPSVTMRYVGTIRSSDAP